MGAGRWYKVRAGDCCAPTFARALAPGAVHTLVWVSSGMQAAFCVLVLPRAWRSSIFYF